MEHVKWAMIDSRRTQRIWWNDVVKAAVEKKDLLEARDEVVKKNAQMSIKKKRG